MVISLFFFFFNDTATTEIYTLSLHDALPIFLLPAGRSRFSTSGRRRMLIGRFPARSKWTRTVISNPDRKSTRLNSSHANISYAVFCLKKKKNNLPRYLDDAPE